MRDPSRNLLLSPPQADFCSYTAIGGSRSESDLNDVTDVTDVPFEFVNQDRIIQS